MLQISTHSQKDNEGKMSIENKPAAFHADSKRAVTYMKEQITHICDRIPPREPGSIGERKTAEYMASVLEKDCGCDSADIESFQVHPASFYGYCRIQGILDFMSCAGFFIHPLITLICGGTSLLLFLLFFVLYIPMIDRFFPERTGTNVTAIRPCKGPVKRRVFFNGHMDAAWEFTLNYHFGGIVFEIPNVMSLVGVLVNISMAICALCGAGDWTLTVMRWALLFIPSYIAIGLTFNPRHIVPGANDNLSGCLIGITILREMEKQGIELEHTEAGVILTGSEEAGLRGSKAWCKAHRKDYQDVPTYIVSIDTIHSPEQLMVNVKDLNGTVSLDAPLSEAFMRAAQEVRVPCRKGKIPLFGGATDGAGFAQGGFRTTSVTGLSHKLEDFYHTRRDTPDALNAKGLENCFKAAVRMIEIIDCGELDSFERSAGINSPEGMIPIRTDCCRK